MSNINYIFKRINYIDIINYIFSFSKFASINCPIILDANEEAEEAQGDENGNYQRDCRR